LFSQKLMQQTHIAGSSSWWLPDISDTMTIAVIGILLQLARKPAIPTSANDAGWIPTPGQSVLMTMPTFSGKSQKARYAVIEETYRLRIGMQTAERIKCEIASLLPGDTTSTVVNGRDIDSGNPRSMQLQAKDITELIKLYINKIYEISTMVLAKLPPEVSAEIRNTGIYLAGGLSRIIGLEEYFHNEFALSVKVNPDPDLAVVIGAGRIMQNEKTYRRLRF